jgi:hypothetical protein
MTVSDSFWLIFWESIATIGIVVVIIGIIGEGSELLVKWAIDKKYRKLQRELDDGFRWILAVLMKFIRPRKLEVETFAFALVVLGLVVEFWGGHKSQQILDRNNAALNKEAGEARQAAGQANERAASIERAAVEMERQSAPRRLTPKKMESLTKRLSEFSNSLVTEIVIPPDNEECSKYADDFDIALQKAKWPTLRTERPPLRLPDMARICVRSTSKAIRQRDILVSALNNSGIDARGIELSNDNGDRIVVYVNSNPDRQTQQRQQEMKYDMDEMEH